MVRWCVLISIVLLAPIGAAAHNLGESYLYLQVYENSIHGRFEIALENLNPGLDLLGTPNEVTAENFESKVDFVKAYYLKNTHFSAQGHEFPVRFTEANIMDAYNGFLTLSFELQDMSEVPKILTIDYSILFDEDPTHRAFALVEHNWYTGTFNNEAGISLVFGPHNRRLDLDLSSSSMFRGFVSVMRLGVEHIWMGYDHVMFLVALLLPSVLRRQDREWQPVDRFAPTAINVVKIVTAFTVAHSLTLSFAALGILNLPSRLVEVTIAASIGIAAADILFPLFANRIWLIVFGFGLFHGFGFAGALSEMGVLGEHLALSLLAFNLGVEIGQIVIVAILFPILYFARNLIFYRKIAIILASFGMIIVSMGWVVERLLDIDIPMFGWVFRKLLQLVAA